MDIQQEKWDYTAMLVAENAITQEQCDTLKLSDGINMFYSDHLASTTIDCINWGWSSWLKAKAKAIPDGFVLIKDDTKTVVAIERMVEQQVEASGMDSRRLERLDGWKIIEAAVEAQEPTDD